MRLYVRVSIVGLSICALAACGVLSYKVCCALFIPQKITFSFDSFLALDQQEAIKSELRSSIHLSFRQLFSLIQEKCPAIASCTFSRLPSRVLHIKATSKIPFVGLNQGWILTEDTHVVPRRLFDENAVESCPIAYVKQGVNPVDLSDHFKNWLVQCDRSFFETHHVTWSDDYHILVQDKKMSAVSLLCSVDVPFDQSMTTTCSSLVKQLARRSEIEKRKWIADVRFDKQIIVAAQGGRGYG